MSSTEEHAAETGRRAVRAHLIEPLIAEGMKRRQGESVEEEKAFLDRVAKRLAYMGAEGLARLLPVVRELAGGAGKNRWPSEISIVNHAHALAPPPDQSDDILWSWLHSRAGVRARADGLLMATRAYIKRFRRPPKDAPGKSFYSGKVLPEMQLEIDRDVEALRRAVSMSEARDSERERLRAHDETLAGLEAIVDAGIAHRREKAEQAAAAEGQAA